jgi:hypothetical protein
MAQLLSEEVGSGPRLQHPNAANVFNFRSDIDVVSRWGHHIGEVRVVPGAGAHGIDAFVECLSAGGPGGWKV